ncbi:BglG family transcription antiterminator [Lacticaseibacillus zeae]|uniref:HTH domain-containing protein n=1 Tax=Lacticaseibacillus zeae TaxID=57037 RepID=A0A5R8LYM4_LACZE|nr:PTS sugar transporter subunit IIA [Lacticaseibacillus zeae]TLF42512.1 HTH domain-containing protein [Lacticaseibacillus zeae]
MREHMIIQTLQANGAMSAAALAEAIGVSRRTLQNDLRLLNRDATGFQICFQRGRGYQLQVTDSQLLTDYLAAMKQQAQPQMPAKRIPELLRLLLTTTQYLTVATLAETQQISPKQLQRDLRELDKLLVGTPLTLERKAHYGVRVCCQWQSRVLALQQYGLPPRHSALTQQVQPLGLDPPVTAQFASEIGWSLAVTGQQPQPAPDDAPFADVVTDIRLGTEAWEFLTISFAAKRKQLTTRLDHDRLKAKLQAYFMALDERHETNFATHPEFLSLMYFHVLALINRLQEHQSLAGLNLEPLARDYPIAFNWAVQFAQWLSQEYQIDVPKAEIGYLTTHLLVPLEQAHEKWSRGGYRIAVVCGTGGGIATLLCLRLRRIFPEAMIQTFGLNELAAIHELSPDLLFTVTTLNESFDCPVIRIDEVASDLDFAHLRHELSVASRHNATASLADLLVPSLFFQQSTPTDYRGLLTTVTATMAEYCEQADYAASVLQREDFLPTIYDNGIAIPHPLSFNAKKNAVAVILLPNSATNTTRPVQLVWLIALKQDQLPLHRTLTMQLAALMQKPDVINKLVQQTEFSSFHQILRTALEGVESTWIYN